LLTKDIITQLNNCKVVSTITQDENEKEWLHVRSNGIGGSDIGTICGVNKWSTPRLLYLKKTGQYKESYEKQDDGSVDRMRFGHLLEPIVAQEFEYRMNENGRNIRIIEVKATFCHKDYKWALANVDRLIIDNETNKIIGVLECKTASEYLKEEWNEGDIPVSYLYQLNWYLWILGLNYGALACLVGGNKFYYYEVYRNDELIKEMLEKADKFWNYNVKNLIEPELDGSEASTRLVEKMNEDVEPNSEIILEDESVNEMANNLIKVKQEIKELEKIKKELENKLKEKIGNHEIAYTTDRVMKWKIHVQRRLDSKKLKKEMPDIYNAFLKEAIYRRFTIK
jgi:putative phage-type endonuclease